MAVKKIVSNAKLFLMLRKNNKERVGVADRLHSAAIHLLRYARKEDVLSGEGPARLSALSVLVFGGPMTLGQLASAEQVKPPTMSRIVAGMERSGLAKIDPDAGDARRIRVSVFHYQVDVSLFVDIIEKRKRRREHEHSGRGEDAQSDNDPANRRSW